MQPARISLAGWPNIGIIAVIDQCLDMNVGDSLKLQIALLGFVRKIVGERPVDRPRMGIMAFDQIRIIAVHRSDEIADCLLNERLDPASEPVRFRHQFQRRIIERSDSLLGKEGLH